MLIKAGANLTYIPSDEASYSSPFVSAPAQAALAESSRCGFVKIVQVYYNLLYFTDISYLKNPRQHLLEHYWNITEILQDYYRNITGREKLECVQECVLFVAWRSIPVTDTMERNRSDVYCTLFYAFSRFFTLFNAFLWSSHSHHFLIFSDITRFRCP